MLNVERATTGYAPCRACDRVLSSTECSLRHGFAACLARHDRIFRFADDIYDSVAPGSSSVDNSRRVLVRHVLRAKALLADIREAGGGRAPATGTRRGSGPKAQQKPRWQIRRNTCPGSLSKKKGMRLPQSRCVFRALALSVSLALRRVLLPLSLCSLSLSAGEFRCRIADQFDRLTYATKGNVQEYTNRSCCLWLACH